MPSHNKPIVPAEPVADEWGFYDPDRAGLAALFEKLDARQVPSRDDALKMAASMREAAELRKEN
jgi:hypothetical protein